MPCNQVECATSLPHPHPHVLLGFVAPEYCKEHNSPSLASNRATFVTLYIYKSVLPLYASFAAGCFSFNCPDRAQNTMISAAKAKQHIENPNFGSECIQCHVIHRRKRFF